jgi:hypothetical protein
MLKCQLRLREGRVRLGHEAGVMPPQVQNMIRDELDLERQEQRGYLTN